MATSTELIQASQDSYLQQRIVALLAARGISDASSIVSGKMGLIVAQRLSDGENLADKYAYANNVRNEKIAQVPQEPGVNPGACTDDMLNEVIDLLGLNPNTGTSQT